MPTEWRTFDQCNATEKWRYLDDGHIEIAGRGVPTRPWPAAMDQWHDVVNAAATKWGVPPAWIAATIMHESVGKQNSCFPCSASPRGCESSPDGCDHGDGFGLMALLTSTASKLAGRSVSADELRSDPLLNVDLGTQYLRAGLDASQQHFGADDIVWAGVAYNAGSVRCTSAECPQDGYGVVYGCIVGASGERISTRYPANLIASVNTAVDNGYVLLPNSAEPPLNLLASGEMDWRVAASIFLGVAAVGYVLARHVVLQPAVAWA